MHLSGLRSIGVLGLVVLLGMGLSAPEVGAQEGCVEGIRDTSDPLSCGHPDATGESCEPTDPVSLVAGLCPGEEPPSPPTTDEALATCPELPAPVIGRDPWRAAITGMEVRLWAEPQGPLTSTAVIRGYAVTCTVAPYLWEWTTGDGGWCHRGHPYGPQECRPGEYSSSWPGGPYPNNPVTHVYNTKNAPDEYYTLTLTVWWQRVTNYGADEQPVTSSEPYHVTEVRSVLSG